jgi:hypothetical protein
MKCYAAGIIVMLLVFTACQKNTISKIPQIRFQSLTPDSVKAGSGLDTVNITFYLTDGDADLGNDPNGTNYDIYIRDSRTDTFKGYFFPSISSEAEDATKGIEGYCTFQQLGAFLIPRADSAHLNGDTLYYEIYIKDRAQHESNHITTPNVYILP